MKKLIIILTYILFVFIFVRSAQAQQSKYKIANKFSVEGDGGWDYIISDDNTDRLFISHGNITQVVDSKSGKLLGTIEDTKGVHGIALAKDENKAFISCGKDSSVTIVNLSTLQFIGKVQVTGTNPDAILYDSFTK